MFVRKGTVRKQRGGSGRRQSTRRQCHNSDGNIYGCSSKRHNTKEDQSPPRSPFLHSPHPDSGAPLASCSTSTIPSVCVPDVRLTSTFEFASTPESPRLQATNNHLHAVRPDQRMPAQKVDTVVCMDEGRRLVRAKGIHDDGEDYTAFMFQVREAGKEASNVFDLSCRLADIMCSSLCVTVFVGVSMAIPLTMFSIGVKYWEDCPKDARVPVYLIVGGCCGLVKLIATLWRNVQTRRHHRLIDEPDVEGAFTNQTFRTMDTLLLLFLISWQVAGTIWTFNIWRPRFEPLLHEPSNWCDRTVYMFAVYQLSSTYAATFVFMFLLLLLTCCQKCQSY